MRVLTCFKFNVAKELAYKMLNILCHGCLGSNVEKGATIETIKLRYKVQP